MRLGRPLFLGPLLFLLVGAVHALGLARQDVLVEGVVVDEGGAPLASVRVQLVAGGQTLAGDLTDALGRFAIFTNQPWSPAWSVRAERLGFAIVEVAVPAGLAPVEVVLTPAPLPLPGFEVVGDRQICSRDGEPEARAIWEATARRHRVGLDTVGVASYTQVRADTLTGDGGAPSGIEGATAGRRASAPLLRSGWERRIDREGYAFLLRRTEASGSYASWSYPPLEADFSSHFGSESFGERHDFLFEFESDDGWTVHFCARDDDDPHLEGVLEIGPDSLIRRVEWRFHTPEPDEEAGGWALFAPTSAGGETQPLLPSESVTWRTIPGGAVVRRAQWYEGWLISDGDSVPFLPQR